MKKYRILLVDDDPIIHKLLDQYFKKTPFLLDHAFSGNEAFAMLEESNADLIVLDINMPQMDGFQTLTKLRENEGYAKIPVIFLSALDRDNLKVKGLELGADDYLTKPFKGQELAARIKAVLRRNKPQALQGDLTGNIAIFGLSELFLTLGMSKKSCLVKFPDMDGLVQVHNGELIDIQQGNAHGEEALLRLFLLERGFFRVNFTDPPDNPSPGLSIDSILLNTATKVDELMEAINCVGSLDTKLGLHRNSSEFPELDKLEGAFPLSLADLLVMLDGPLTANLENVDRALKDGVLKTYGDSG